MSISRTACPELEMARGMQAQWNIIASSSMPLTLSHPRLQDTSVGDGDTRR